jgi:hypothetical protein
MPAHMIRYQVADEGVAEVISAAKAAFAAVEAQQPDGIRYGYYRYPGSTEFFALLELDDGTENPLPGIEAARELQSTVARWVAGDAPAPQPLELLGSYSSAR